ncbi:MAG: hypothetical protein OEZ22_02710, partial [Spirochaetia bacterium]|nr:hypothetical protein [Spirochaetia bacterium]
MHDFIHKKIVKILKLSYIIIILFFFSSISLFANSRLPAESYNWLHVTGGASSGDIDGLTVIFFEVPEAETSTIYFGINDPGCDNVAPDDCTSNADTNYYLFGGSGALSHPDSRLRDYSGQQAKAKTGGSLLSSFTYGNSTAEGWVYFSGVSASQGEKIGNKYYFKIVIEAASASLGNNAYQVDISYQNTGTPVGVADVKTFSYSWTIDLRDDGNLWNLYPFVPEGAAGSLIVHNYDMDNNDSGNQYGISPVYNNKGAITVSGNGEAQNGITIGTETNGTWKLVLTGDNDGGGENTAEFWFTNSVTSELYRIYSSSYNPSTADHVALSYNDGMVINNGTDTETVVLQIVDSSLNPLPYSKNIYVYLTETISNSTAVITESNNGVVNSQSTVVTTDSSGMGYIKVKDTEIETITVNLLTDGTNGSNDFGAGADDVKTISSVSNIPPKLSSVSNKTFTKGAGSTLGPDIKITNSPISTLLTATNDIYIKIPPELSAVFDTSVINPTYTIANGTGAISAAAVTYLDSNKTVKIDITTSLSVNAELNISGLKYMSFNTESNGKMTLCYDGTGIDFTVIDDKVYSVLDLTPPTITLRETVDLDKDGYIDAIHLTFSKNVKDSSVTAANFSINAGAVAGLAFSSTTNGDTANDNDIYITFTEDVSLKTDASPTIKYTAGTLTDLAGNAMVTEAVATTSTDKAPPAFTALAPATGSSVNTANVSYTLSENISSGTVTYTWVSGTADTNHTVTLTGAELSAGAFSGALSAPPTLLEGAVYNISFVGTDALANAGTAVSVSNITYDLTTQTPTLTSPASSSTVLGSLNVNFTLPENGFDNSLKLTITQTGGTADAGSPHVLTMVSETSGNHSLTLDGANLGANSSIVTYIGTSLVSGAVYSFKLEYQDFVGNTVSSVTNTNILFDVDTTQPQLVSVSLTDAGNSGAGTGDTIVFVFNEAIDAASITSSLAGSITNNSFASGSGNLTGTVLDDLIAELGSFATATTATANLSTLAMSADGTTLTLTLGGTVTNGTFPGGVFTPAAAAYTDLSGNDINAVVTQTTTGKWDTSTDAPALTSPVASSNVGRYVNLNYTIPEPAADTSVKLTITGTLGDANTYVLTMINETSGNFVLDTASFSSNNTAYVESVTGGDTLVLGATYSFKIEYDDIYINGINFDENTNIFYDGTAPELVSVTLTDAGNSGAGAGDTIVFVFNEAIDPASITSSLAGSITNNSFTNGSGNLTGTVLNDLIVELGSFATATTTTANLSTLEMSADGKTFTLTLGGTIANGTPPGGVFTPAASYTDLAGNAINTSVTQTTAGKWDSSTELPTLSSPLSSSSVPQLINVSYSLPEAASDTTVKIIITNEAVPATYYTITMPNETAGVTSVTLDGSNLSGSTGIESVAGTGGNALVDGVLYTFRIEYQDAYNNAAAFTQNTGIKYDITAPTLTTVSISSNNTNTLYANTGHTITLNITAIESLSVAPTVTIAGQTATVAGLGPYTATYTLLGSETEGIIPFTIDFTDLAGNNGIQVTTVTDSTSVTFDKTAPLAATGIVWSETSPFNGLTVTSSWTVSASVDLA